MASIIGKPDWFPDWTGETVAIIASGPSAKEAKKHSFAGLRVITINESHQLCPTADMLYGCDGGWWHLRKGVVEFKGLKVTQDIAAAKAYKLHHITVDGESDVLQFDQYGRVGAGGNSGFQCINLAAQFGVSRMLLIGFDMRVDMGEHWHDRHPPPLSNPHPRDNIPRWTKAIDGAQFKLVDLGIEVINCSQISALRAYPKMTIADAIRSRT